MIDEGCLAYRFRGRYYCLVDTSHDDRGFPQSFGESIVSDIPFSPAEYHKWRMALQSQLEEWEQALMTHILPIPEELINSMSCEEGEGLYFESRVDAYLDDRMLYTPSLRLPERDDLMRRVYIIDLDNDLFIVDGGAHFKLDQIGRHGFDSDTALASGFTHARMLNVEEVPAPIVPHRRSTGELTRNTLAPGLEMKVITAKGLGAFSKDTVSGARFLLELWKGLRKRIADELPYTPIELHIHDFAFREIAFAILSLAAGLSGTVSLKDKNRIKLPDDREWVAVVPGEDPEGPAYIISKIGLGFHQSGQKSGSAPTETTYWFNHILVHLVQNLSTEENVFTAYSNAIIHAKTTMQESKAFNIVLLSIRHIVLIRHSPFGVQRTPLLPLLQIVADDDADFSAHYLLKKREEEETRKEATIGDDYADDDGDESALKTDLKKIKTPVESSQLQADHDATFSALIHLFEASAEASLKPEAPKEGLLPTELYYSILQYVDEETQRACLGVSRKFRRICHERFRISQDHELVARNLKEDFEVINRVTGEYKRLKIGYRGDWHRRNNEYHHIITYGHRPMGAAEDSGSGLSFIGMCSLGGLRDSYPWPADFRSKLLVNKSDNSDDWDEKWNHYWEDTRFTQNLTSLRSSYSGSLDWFHTSSILRKVLKLYQIYFDARHYADISEPANVKPLKLRLNVAKQHRSGRHSRVGDWYTLLMHIYWGRPTVLRDVDATFDCMLAYADKERRKGGYWDGIGNGRFHFVLFMVNLSVTIYEYEYFDEVKFSPSRVLGTRRLNIFEEGDRETFEKFLVHLSKWLDLFREDMSGSERDQYFDWS